MRPSISQINELGRRLGDPSLPSSLGDRRALQAFIGSHQPVLEYAEQVAESATEVAVSSRLKTEKTIIEKLRRFKTRLSKMQDVAGVRLVVQTFWEQDAVVASLTAAFAEARIEDRRRHPQHGYRAVHVIPTIDGRFVEIQVRTDEQHVWADTVEQLADAVGRDIRYGAKPTDPDARRIYELLVEISEVDIEQADREFLAYLADLEQRRRRILELGVPKDPEMKRKRELALRQGRRLVRKGVEHVLRTMDERAASLDSLRQLAEEIRERRVDFSRGVEWPSP